MGKDVLTQCRCLVVIRGEPKGGGIRTQALSFNYKKYLPSFDVDYCIFS